MELWDGYQRDGTLARVDLVRGEIVPEGLYHLVCEIIVEHQDGSILAMQRDPRKPNHPGHGKPRRAVLPSRGRMP